MGVFENEGTETSTEEQRKEAEAAQDKLKKYNDRIKAARAKKAQTKGGRGTILGNVAPAPSAFGIMSAGAPLAEEFTIVGALPDINDGRPNTLPVHVYDDNGNENDYLYIEVPEWADTADESYAGISFDEVRLVFNGVDWEYDEAEGDVPARFPYPITSDVEFPIQVYVTPQMLARLPEGIAQLSYYVINSEALNRDDSLAQPITLDRYAPSRTRRPDPLGVPAGITPPAPGESIVFTAEYLQANDPVVFPVPGYTVARMGDIIKVYSSTQAAPIHEGPIWVENADDRLSGIAIPAAVLIGLGNGSRELQYTLGDRAGNVSGVSTPLPVTIRLTAQPGILQAPEVPSPIYRTQAGAGVQIKIPTYPNSLPTDTIEVSWVTPDGTRTLPTFPFSQESTTVDWAFLSTPDHRAVYDGQVFYKVIRGADSFGPSPDTPVQVDLSVIGPVNPDEPDPVNSDLTKLIVRGQTSGQDNIINHLDENLPGTIHFTVFEGAEAGHVVRFFYGAVELAPPHELTQDEVDEGKVEVPLPWATIQAQGNGSIPAYYRIFEVAGSPNYQQSLTTFVTVSVITVPITNFVAYNYPSTVPASRQNQRPGTPINQTGVINCSSRPWLNLNLLINYRDNELQVGDEVTLYWVFCRDSLGQQEVDDTRYEATLTVSRAQDAVKSVDIAVPYQAARFGEGTVTTPPPPNRPNPVTGSIVCYFTVRRGSAVGKSPKCMVKYNTVQGGVVCSAWPSRA